VLLTADGELLPDLVDRDASVASLFHRRDDGALERPAARRKPRTWLLAMHREISDRHVAKINDCSVRVS